MVEINVVSKNLDKMRNIASLERIRSKTQQTPTETVQAHLFHTKTSQNLKLISRI